MGKSGISVVAFLAMATAATLGTAGSVQAGPLEPGSFYASIFGGIAGGSGSVASEAIEYENVTNNPTWYEHDLATGTVGNGGVFGLTFGAMVDNHSRVEFELSHAMLQTTTTSLYEDGYLYSNGYFNEWNSYSNTTSGSIGATFVLANYWYDFDPMNGFSPYVGGGVGVAMVNGRFASDFSYSNDPASYVDQVAGGLAPAGQIGAGVRMPITDNMTLDFGYRFKTALVSTTIDTDAEVEGPGGSEYAYYTGQNMFVMGVHTFQVGLSVAF